MSHWFILRVEGAIEARKPGFQGVGIGGSTNANFPRSVAIQNLTVAAPDRSANQLLLNYAGLTVGLNVAGDFVLGPNASLVSYYSSLHAQKLWLSGLAIFAEQSVGSFGTINLNGGSTFNLANGAVTEYADRYAGFHRFQYDQWRAGHDQPRDATGRQRWHCRFQKLWRNDPRAQPAADGPRAPVQPGASGKFSARRRALSSRHE